MKTRITKTLLDSWAYTFDCFEDCEEDAMNDFIKTLRREPIEDNEYMANGRAFEALIYEIAEGRFHPEWEDDGKVNPSNGEVMGHYKYPKWYSGAKQIADIIRGGQWQVHVSTDLTVGGRDFWLHGYCDAVKAGVIYDIKWKKDRFYGKEVHVYGSYLHNSQHSAYLRCLPEASQFIYLVSDGEELYTETYDRTISRPIEEIIAEFMQWLESKPELLQIYEEKWAIS